MSFQCLSRLNFEGEGAIWQMFFTSETRKYDMKKCVDERTVPSQVSTFEIANKNIVAPFHSVMQGRQ